MISFVPQTIVILDLGRKPHEISAIAGKNTGLAYHRATLGYVLTHVESGTRITDPNVIETPGQAQLYATLLSIVPYGNAVGKGMRWLEGHVL